MKIDVKPYEEKMKKSISVFEEGLSLIRAGKANPLLLNRVMVDYYGSPTPIRDIAQIIVVDARTITIQPWDKSALKGIEKAILASPDIGITPQNDGTLIRLVFPPVSEDRRREIAKQIEKSCEETKVAMRNIRREANDRIKEMKKKSEMTEDEEKASNKLIQDLLDKYIKIADEMASKKKAEVMSI